jgi:hypothetical protein
MTPSDDPLGDMARFPSTRDVERLLAGDVVNDDLPGEAARLARLLSSMRNPGAAGNPLAEQRAISTIAARIRRSASEQPELMSSRGFSRRVSAKAAAIGLAAVLATGTAAAAANGSLPGPVQRAVSDTLSHVSISVPHPNEHANAHAKGPGPENGGSLGRDGAAPPAGAQGPDAAGNARSGLCTAAAQGPSATSNGKRESSVAFSNLQRAAAHAGLTVTEFCAGVTHHENNGGNAATTSTVTTTVPVGGGASTTTTTHPHGPPSSTPKKGARPTPTTHTRPITPSEPTGVSGSGTSHTPTTTSGTASAQSQASAGS